MLLDKYMHWVQVRHEAPECEQCLPHKCASIPWVGLHSRKAGMEEGVCPGIVACMFPLNEWSPMFQLIIVPSKQNLLFLGEERLNGTNCLWPTSLG